VIALLVARFLPKDWKRLQWPCFDPLIKCGQQSLPVFCIGVFLSFVVYSLVTISLVRSCAGFAYYSDWSKRTDKIIKRERAAERAPKT
jgi:hypothetical protein